MRIVGAAAACYIAAACTVVAFVPASAESAAASAVDAARTALGRALFFDSNLSLTRNQSCASCHSPDRAYSEQPTGPAKAVVPTSADGELLGHRNVPSLGYAALVPEFQRTATGEYLGGLFLDGRVSTLAAQAIHPITDPREMQMPNAAALVARLRENREYVVAFRSAFGVSLDGPVDATVNALGEALAAYQRTPDFVAFDSRYDRSLRGELRLAEREARGRDLFYSSLTNCARCHVLDTTRMAAREVFTNQRYFNIGTPANTRVTALPGARAVTIDPGLAANSAVAEQDRPAARGRYRVPSLRNVAVTGPYMHNGVFARLDTVIVFYNQYLRGGAQFATNPETGEPWEQPEVSDTIEHGLLRDGQPMESERVADLVAFLRALTDRRYEHLLEQVDVEAAGGGAENGP